MTYSKTYSSILIILLSFNVVSKFVLLYISIHDNLQYFVSYKVGSHKLFLYTNRKHFINLFKLNKIHALGCLFLSK